MKKLLFRERLEKLRVFLKKDWQSLADDFGTSPSGISTWRTGKAAPNFERLSMFASIHPEINAAWLLTGEGEMLETSTNIIQSLNQNTLLDDTPLKKEMQKIWGKLQHLENQIENLSAKSEERYKKD